MSGWVMCLHLREVSWVSKPYWYRVAAPWIRGSVGFRMGRRMGRRSLV